MVDSKWIKFIEKPKPADRKTAEYMILAIQGGDVLGVIKWYGPWRKYSFFPHPNTIFETDCLKDIVSFITELMFARKVAAQGQKQKAL